jgi:phage tail sheath protein FI
MTDANQTGTIGRYPNNSSQTLGNYDFTGLSGLNLQIVIDGTDNILIDNIVQVVDIDESAQTTQDVVDFINNQIDVGDIPGGFVAVVSSNFLKLQTLHTGAGARLLVKTSSTADALFGLDNDTHTGTSPAGVSGTSNYTAGRVTGSVNSGGTVCFSLSADSAGIDGNQTQVKITNNIVDGNFTLEVYSYGSQVEQFGLLSKDETNTYFVESYLSLVSNYVRVANNDNTLALPANGIYQLAGGSDGIPADPDSQDILLIGSATSMTGLQALSDPEQVDIDLVAVPGHPSTANILGLLDFCENVREDCFSVIEPPFGLSVTEIIHWQNGTHPLNDTRFDSNFGSLYWPWVKVRDTFNRVDVWVPPAGVVLGAIARSDTIAAPWIAPAGTTRGLCPTVLDVFTRPTLAERDSMYGNRNAVNPIVNFPDIEAFVIMGNKTLQRLPSALDRINVRRMMLYVEKQIKNASRDLLFEPNDSVTWSRFVSIATGILDTVKNGRGITDYKVQCDDQLNTADVVDRNEMRARIGIIPTKAVEFIFIEFSIFRTGTAFTESTTF